MSRIKKESIKIQPTFNRKQVDVIRKYKGIMGLEDAEIVKNIILNWLVEKGNLTNLGEK